MKIALLSFVSEPPHDPLGELVQQRLTRSDEDQIVREVLRPDLGRLKGLLLAALTDPRFDGILVVADLPGMGNEALISHVEASLQQHLPAWQPLVAQLLWPHIGSNALWSHGCLGRSHRRLLGALTGDQKAVESVLEGLLVPQLDRLLDWSAR
ncbi:hypothetical protein ABS71_12575 [bacterium SCN 62-11]|nr:hypothetical protein [Candidatus Eremiobacteraeota bacterium]ODT64916.1 MAG: hypothetical protein ABS71_12575 [bacterium SCN 62-11]